LFARFPLKEKYRYTNPSSQLKITRKYRNVITIVLGTNPYEMVIDPKNGMNIPIKINSRTFTISLVFPIQVPTTTDLLKVISSHLFYDERW
jgi:predicted nucleotide-binding protein (sugar kinase/HSP70/actin superfamily)